MPKRAVKLQPMVLPTTPNQLREWVPCNPKLIKLSMIAKAEMKMMSPRISVV